ncbi:MAG TPA: hypothetical protein VIL20_28260 [Sandaracinaceae bacterium]
MRRPLGTALFALGLAACAGRLPDAGFPEDEPEAPGTSGLLWFVDANGAHRTLWVSTEDGRPLASQPIEGPLWAQGSALWQWIPQPAEVALSGCTDAIEAEADEAIGTATAQRVVLRELTQSVELEIVPPPQRRPLRGLAHSVRPVASVGPYLFVVEELELDTCGAQRHVEASAFVWDLEGAQRTEVLTERERAALAEREATRARARLRERGDVEDVRLVALEPRWEKRGLALDYRFVADVCPACGDGAWSSSTIAASVPAPELPERLAAHARIPRWARAALAELEGATLAGFTRVEHPAPAHVLDALRR